MEKTISYKAYREMGKSLVDYVDNRKDAYNWLFKAINGREPFTARERTWGGKVKNLLTLNQVKNLWDDTQFYKRLIKLVILKHYVGNKIYLSENICTIITEEYCRVYAITMVQEYKKSFEVMEDEVA